MSVKVRTVTRIIRIVLPLAIVVVAAIAFGVSALVHKTQGIQVNSLSDMGKEVCSGNQKIKNAAAYKGAGPHKMYVGTESSVVQTQPLLTDYSQSFLHPLSTPSAAKTYSEMVPYLTPDSVEHTALVSCISRVNETDTGKRCSYDVGTLDVFDAHYKLDVYVARTHKLLKSVSLGEEKTSDFVCPASVYFDPRNNRQYLDYAQSQLFQIIKPLITATV